MKFTFAEKRMDSSEDLRAYATRKISKLDRFFKTEAEAFVTFSLERGRFRAEITIHNNGTYYRASELTSDMYASIDSGVAAIERQIRRNKTRLEKRLREGALEKDSIAAVSYGSPSEDEPVDEFQIVRNK
ncbi:MAG: ribosome-associated translation inhibitor RaiA, partial [Anaerolineaceae bacterium]|nr:ribosome-associated translation inhibitor RaiA [Anaerolineaceae bacterium]